MPVYLRLRGYACVSAVHDLASSDDANWAECTRGAAILRTNVPSCRELLLSPVRQWLRVNEGRAHSSTRAGALLVHRQNGGIRRANEPRKRGQKRCC